MSVRSDQRISRRQASPIAIVVGVVALVAFLAWRGWVAFAGPPTGKLPPPPTKEINFLHQKAHECKGDFSKLSPDDQAKVQQASHGFGPAAMASDWREESKKSP